MFKSLNVDVWKYRKAYIMIWLNTFIAVACFVAACERCTFAARNVPSCRPKGYFSHGERLRLFFAPWARGVSGASAEWFEGVCRGGEVVCMAGALWVVPWWCSADRAGREGVDGMWRPFLCGEEKWWRTVPARSSLMWRQVL